MESLLAEKAASYCLPVVSTEKAQTNHYLFGECQTKKVTAQEISERLWSAEDADLFAAMALFLPSLLTAEEHALWQVITDIPYFWNHFEIHIENPAGQVVDKEWWPLVDYRGLNRERLREHWLLCKAILDGEKPLQHLRACSKSPRLSQNSLIFEHRSAVYMRVNEQRSAKNQRIMASLGDLEQALKELNLPPGKPVEKPDYYPPIKKVRSDS